MYITKEKFIFPLYMNCKKLVVGIFEKSLFFLENFYHFEFIIEFF